MNSMEQHFRLAEIEVKKSTLDEKILGLFRYESEGRQKRGPTFLLAVEIASTAYVYEQLLDVLNAAAEQVRRLTSGFETDPMARFEKAVQRLNEAAANFVEQSPTPIAWNRVNIFVMELSDDQLCFSGTGMLTNLFLQKQDNGSYRSFDLFGSLEQPPEPDPKKIFGSLVCGDFKVGDILLVGSQNLERLRGELRLIDRLSSLPLVTAALEIKQDLERRDIPDDFSAVAIASVELPTPEAGLEIIEEDSAPTEKSTESIERLYQQEEEAEAMLSPTTLTSLPSTSKGQPLQNITGKASAYVTNAFQWTKSLIQKRRKEDVQDPVTMASLRGMNAGHGTTMTKKRKTTLIAGALILLAALIGTLWISSAKKAAAEQTVWNLSYDQVVDRKNRAEADLVYNNETHARELLAEAVKILDGLDEKNASRKKAKADLTQELNDVRNKLKKETTVEKPSQLFALPTDAVAAASTFLAVWKERVYTVDVPGQAVIQVTPDTKEVKRIGLSAKDADVKAITAGTNGILLLSATGTLLNVDPVAGTAKPLSFASTKAQSITSLLSYNRKLYALDPAKNMIWKYAASEAGFGSESTYLKQTSAGLTDATTIAIDSNVYVGFKNGKIARYLSGAEELWALSQIDPPLQSVASIWTSPDTDRLVVADPAGKRVVVFRKDGVLISQILSPEFKGPVAVSADEKSKKIYVLDGNRIFQLDLP